MTKHELRPFLVGHWLGGGPILVRWRLLDSHKVKGSPEAAARNR